jgi:hypothetical protein
MTFKTEKMVRICDDIWADFIPIDVLIFCILWPRKGPYAEGSVTTSCHDQRLLGPERPRIILFWFCDN